jgi:hypothetical protein
VGESFGRRVFRAGAEERGRERPLATCDLGAFDERPPQLRRAR